MRLVAGIRKVLLKRNASGDELHIKRKHCFYKIAGCCFLKKYLMEPYPSSYPGIARIGTVL
jgi:hypothetical protein